MPTLISVQSCRHGVGRTNLTANLAACIARYGYRVGVLDADGTVPGVHTLFGEQVGAADEALNRLIWGEAEADAAKGDEVPLRSAAIDRSTAADYSPADRAIAVGRGSVLLLGGELCLVPPDLRVSDVRRCLQQGYNPDYLGQGVRAIAERLGLEYLLIDTYPELDEGTMLWMAVSDGVLLVLGLDATEFQGLAVRMDVANTLEVPRVWLLANQVPPTYALGDVWRKLERGYGADIIGVLPTVEQMMTLGSSGIFLDEYPDHPLSLALDAIARQMMEALNPSQG